MAWLRHILWLATSVTVALMACLPSELLFKSMCLRSCPKDKFISQQICVDKCPPNTEQLDTEMSKVCYFEDEFTCRPNFCDDDYPLCYRMNCLKTCPEYTVEFNHTCLIKCPIDASFLTSKSCEGLCWTGQKTCSKTCPKSHPFVFQTKTLKHCLKSCPKYTEASLENMTCNLHCPLMKPFLLNNTCIKKCPRNQMYISIYKSDYNEIYVCTSICPESTVNDNYRCVPACPKGKHLFNGTCVLTCPKSSIYLYPKTARYQPTDIAKFGLADFMCVDSCNSNNTMDYYGKPSQLVHGNMCLENCPKNATYEFNGFCLSSCPLDHPYEKSSLRSVLCVSKCENLYYRKKCVTNCPYEARYTQNVSCVNICGGPFPFSFVKIYENNYRFNEKTQKTENVREFHCLKSCPVNTFIYNDTNCVSSCPVDKNYEMNSSCIKSCPDTHDKHLPQGSHFKCVEKCTVLTYGKMCVSQCPTHARYVYNSSCVTNCYNDLPYKFNEVITIKTGYRTSTKDNYKCIENCPTNTFLYNNTQCVTLCPLDAKYHMNLTCVSECNFKFPLERDDIIRFKISDWPLKYKTNHIYECLDECPSNNVIYNASKCISACPLEANFEINGSCHEHCPASYDYKLPIGSYYKCQNGCSGMLIFNNTCVGSCPNEARYESNGVCVPSCDVFSVYRLTYLKTMRGKMTHYCLDRCHSNTFEFNNSCLTSCPENSFTVNSTCLVDCPTTKSMNYTKNSNGYGFYTCVESCPNNTVFYNKTCFDKCPGHLRNHASICTGTCPSTHPFIDSHSRCVQQCENDYVVSRGNFCEEKCPKLINFIEGNVCIKTCISRKAVYVITAQGKKCHKSCPNHLLLKEGTNICVNKCSTKMLIIDSTCRKLDKCPDHKFIEHSGIGRRCTNRCSDKFYLDGSNCVKECPKQKVIAGIECADSCPRSYPLSYKGYSYSNARVTCYKRCPSGFVANNSKCIDEYECTKSFFSYNHVCYESCPYLTVQDRDNACQSMIQSICITVFSLICMVVILTFFYFNTCYTGKSSVTDNDALQEDEIEVLTKLNICKNHYSEEIVITKILNHEIDRPHTNLLIESDASTENVTEYNTECLLKEDVVTEIDDGYTVHNK